VTYDLFVEREGYASFEGSQTWYRVHGDLSGNGSVFAPLVVVHGGPGATHDGLSPLVGLARHGRAIVFYDQIGNGNSTHYPGRGAEFWTVELFVRELANLIDHLSIDRSYHLLGQSWGGCLAQEHALSRPPRLRSIVLSNTAASYADYAFAANELRRALPPDVEATLRRHEAAGTTDDPAYFEACMVFYRRHLCRLDPWPDDLVAAIAMLSEDPTVYHTMNGPSEFYVTGTAKTWSVLDRLHEISVPAFVISGEHDEATPALQKPLVDGMRAAGNEVEQLIMADCSHLGMWEQPDVYLSAVDDWLRRHD
jgi:L-proline amide hydrolase